MHKQNAPFNDTTKDHMNIHVSSINVNNSDPFEYKADAVLSV
jgi:hypothetical protein